LNRIFPACRIIFPTSNIVDPRDPIGYSCYLAEDLEQRYQEAMYGNNSRMPSVFRDDIGY
jgi:hypothetical protein